MIWPTVADLSSTKGASELMVTDSAELPVYKAMERSAMVPTSTFTLPRMAFCKLPRVTERS